jgi:PAS domain S-box-containing protein
MTQPDREALRSETRLRSTLDHLLEGAQIIDREWRYVYLNPAAARHGGRTVDELLGRTMFESYPGIDQTPMFEVLRQAMETHAPSAMENQFAGPNGVAKWFQLYIQPVPEGVFILSLDITDRKHAEEELAKNRARFEAIVENLHEGLILADLQGKLLHWNRAALSMLGFSSSEERGGAISDFARMFALTTVDGEVVPPEDRPMARVLRGEKLVDLELRVSRIGEPWERLFVYNGSIVHYDDDALAFVSIRDVTEQRELERRYIRAQRMESIGTLAGGVAHDLNNILMPIVFGATLLRRVKLDERSMHTIETIERAAKRGADLVKQILSFARGAVPARTAVNLHDVASEVGSIVRSTFPKSITLSTDLPPNLYPVSGDFTQLVQILLNLCVNARDAMQHGGRIDVSAINTAISAQMAQTKQANAGHYVILQVTDEGKGMPDEIVQRIFEPFFTTKEVGQGTGLGLSTVQDIVRRYGGFLDVFSEVGKGTTFRVFLPTHFAAQPAAEAASEIENLPHGNGEVILIVDDETSILNVAKQTLEAFGYEVITAEDGAQAIASYARERSSIAVVITDMMMPMVDGPAVIAALVRMNPDLPVIATSGSSLDDWMTRAERAGARYHLSKPYTAPVLLRMVAGILGSRE